MTKSLTQKDSEIVADTEVPPISLSQPSRTDAPVAKDARAVQIQALRDTATFFEQHPEIALPRFTTIDDFILAASAPDLRDALAEAIELIHTWHNMGAGDPGISWDIYRLHSPEMTRLTAALAKATGETQS